MVILLSIKHPDIGMVLNFTKKKNQFCCLQEIENKWIKIETNKKSKAFFFKKIWCQLWSLFYFAFDHLFFLFNLIPQCCVN